MKLEELLNKLVEKGWCPMGNRPITQLKKNVKVERYNKKPVAVVIKNGRRYADDYYSLREIVSIDSGLWQFVCENGMIKTGRVFISWTKNANCDCYGNLFWDKACPKDFYEYRLIESALKNEDELEQFLLNNIEIGK